MSNKNSMPLSMRSGTSLTRALVLLTLDELINHCVHGGARRGNRLAPREAGDFAGRGERVIGLVRPAASRYLRRLREADLVQSRPDGRRRLFSQEPKALQDVDIWLDQFRGLWNDALSALDAEV